MARIASAPDTGAFDAVQAASAAPQPALSAAPRASARDTHPGWFPRLLALLALLVAAVAVIVAVAGVKSPAAGPSQAEATSAINQIDTANRRLSDQLDALRVGASTRAAQDPNRAAYALAKHLDATTAAGGDTGDAVHQALRAELAYTDAVGSTIYNPRSTLRSRIVPLASRLRSALLAANGDPARVTGAQRLVAVATARAGG